MTQEHFFRTGNVSKVKSGISDEEVLLEGDVQQLILFDLDPTIISTIQGPMLLNFMSPYFTNVRNKLECLLLASQTSLAKCLCVMPESYTIVEHLKGA
jgi:hypothetical protein